MSSVSLCYPEACNRIIVVMIPNHPIRCDLPKNHDGDCSHTFIGLAPRPTIARPPAGDWSMKAAEEIFALYKNASYFSTANAEQREQLLRGWAEIIARNAR